ncbi:hypothetical protein KRMM14A1259_47410 [Krasilnikovia sp. MM14-A1259]
MGSVSPEREEPLARTRHVAAARRYLSAVASVQAVGVPIDPGPPGAVRDWDRNDIAALRELHEALGEMLSARQSWDATPMSPSRSHLAAGPRGAPMVIGRRSTVQHCATRTGMQALLGDMLESLPAGPGVTKRRISGYATATRWTHQHARSRGVVG